MKMKRVLALIVFVLIPSLVEAQGWIRYYPPGGGFSGGPVSTPILFPVGTEALPSAAVGDTDTGFWNAGVDRLCATTGGVTRWCTIGNSSFFVRSSGLIGFASSDDPESASVDAFFTKDAAHFIAQRNGTNPQTFRVYNTFTDASNYERGFMFWTGNIFSIGNENAGTGGFRQTRVYGTNVAFYTHATASTSATQKFSIAADGTTTVIAGTSTGFPTVGGVICVNTTSTATTGTVEEVLATCTLPANALSANGKGVRISATATTAANGNTKVYRIRFGGIAGGVLASPTITTSGAGVSAIAHVIRTGSSAQYGWSQSVTGTDGATGNSSFQDVVLGATDTGTIDIVVTGTTATAAGDLTHKAVIVEFFN